MRRIEADQQHLGFSNPGTDHDQQRSRVASNADQTLVAGNYVSFILAQMAGIFTLPRGGRVQ
jgi:hypothetical protein